MKTSIKRPARRPFDSKGTNVLPVGTFVLTSHGERGWIDEMYPKHSQYSVRTSYGRGGNQIRTRDQIRPITHDEFDAYHAKHGNSGMRESARDRRIES
jgi:hypothetical protein